MISANAMFQAGERAAARVALHPVWPVPIELYMTIPGGIPTLQCVVHTYNAQERDFSLADLCMIDCVFSQAVPEIDILDCDAQLHHIIERLRQTALHELEEFLLVDGDVAASPHAAEQRDFSFVPPSVPLVPSARNEVTTWRAAIARVALHPAWRLRVDLGICSDLQDNTTITCALRQTVPSAPDSPDIPPTMTFSKTPCPRNTDHVPQLLALGRHAVQHLFDDCLIVDGRPFKMRNGLDISPAKMEVPPC